MSWQPTRDLVGYGPNPPDPQWPGGARVAVRYAATLAGQSLARVHPSRDGTRSRWTACRFDCTALTRLNSTNLATMADGCRGRSRGCLGRIDGGRGRSETYPIWGKELRQRADHPQLSQESQGWP